MLQQYGVWIALACAIVGILYGVISASWIMKQPAGNDRMREIAQAVQVGAKAYLNRQYTFIAIAGIVLFIIIGFVPGLGWPTAIGFAIGAILSGAAGYIGMNVSVRANVRTAEAARNGISAAMNVSPAPTVSRTSTVGVTTSISSPTRASTAPSAPHVTATIVTPRDRRRSITSLMLSAG